MTATPTSGEGELGLGGCAAFLSAPHFDRLPCVLETPGLGKDHGGPPRTEVELARKLRKRGLEARRRAARSGGAKRARASAPASAPERRSGRGCHGQRPESALEVLPQGERVAHAEGTAEANPASAGSGVDVEHHLGLPG